MPSDPIRVSAKPVAQPDPQSDSQSDPAPRGEGVGRVGDAVPPVPEEVQRPMPRPISHIEEGEPDRSGEWWTLVKAVVIGIAALTLIGWLISR